MLTINYNWKTYTTKEYTQWDTIIGAHVRNWIKKWFLEEVKENKDSTLEKLREELERREKAKRNMQKKIW